MIVRNSLLGASISRPKGIVRHRGTCADHQCATVVDTMPETGARLVRRDEFLAGRHAQIDSVGQTPWDQKIRAMRALQQVGKLPYSAAHCDILATYVETGTAWSPQAVGLIALTATIFAIWAVHKS
ncbi:MAG TPA: hypothetical protein VNH18_05755 [Bryobacteraceae bacterium]|nr:hypothetical protein [Bryobacteraceae bacterium]